MSYHCEVKRGKASGGYWMPVCSCGWTGISYRISGGSEYLQLANRDSEQHNYCHEHGKGFFDYTKGWIPGANDPVI